MKKIWPHLNLSSSDNSCVGYSCIAFLFGVSSKSHKRTCGRGVHILAEERQAMEVAAEERGMKAGGRLT